MQQGCSLEDYKQFRKDKSDVKAPGKPLGLAAVICTRNRPTRLQRALLSLTEQTLPPDEIIVVDNAPPDDATRELVTNQFPEVRYIREPAEGLDYARNRALAESNCEIIAYLDDDAVADNNWSKSILKVFKENPEVGACTGRVLPLSLETEAQRIFESNGGFSRGNAQICLPRDANKRLHGMQTPLIAWAVSVGSGCSMAVKRSVVLALGGFDEGLDLGSVMPGGGDLDILWRVLTGGFSVNYEPRVLAWHEHRRELPAVFDQIVGHQLSLIAFLTKSLVRARGWLRLQVLAFLAWRLVKPGARLVRRLFGRDPLPVSVIFRMWWNCWRGLRAYSGARKEATISSDSRSAGVERNPGIPGNADVLAADASSSRFVELWHSRGLLRRLIMRNLMVKYQRSLLGFFWTLINPIVTLAVLIAVFSHVVRIPIPNYWAFLLSGYFVWNFTIQTLNMGTYIFSEHSKLLRTASFPSEILVFSAAIAKLIEFAAAMVLVLISIIAFHHHGVPLSFSILPLLVFMQLLVIIGLALLITSLSVFYYDVHHALPIALATLFYASPVFYPVSLVPEIIRPYYMLNPIAGLLKLFHLTIYEGSMPPISLLAGTLAYSAAIFLLGYAIFRRYETVYAEII